MSTQNERSFKARPKIEASETVGCYYCCETYSPKRIREWVDYRQTAMCPKCGIDSVVPFDKELDKDLKTFQDKLEQWSEESFSSSKKE